MRYPPSILEDIKTRLPASLVVGRRVKLQKAGREWKGLSPFNAERTPSFFVNDQKQAWFDFSSGRNGDIFTFLIEAEGLSFMEAVERLAAEAGVPLPKETPEAARQEKTRKGLSEAMELASAYFQEELRGPKGREARAYLAGRGIEMAVIERFGIGYASADRYALRDHLAGAGIASEVMIEAGLLIAGDDIPVAYDRFRERVMFPIQDVKGRVIAFGGRALSKDAQAKYLNSPETPVFHKGGTLYNLNRARKPAHDAGTLIVVEGYVDAIAFDRAGIGHVVAPLGTALSEDQLALIWRMVPEPVLCFDGDKAGIRAAYRAIDIALPIIGAGRSLRFVFLPEGQDPDDLLRAEGPAALVKAIGSPRPLVEVLFEREIGKAPLETPEQRADCEKRLFGAVSQIADEDLKRHYRQAMRERLSARFAPVRRARGYGAPREAGARRRFNGVDEHLLPLIASERLKRNPLFRAMTMISAREAVLVLAPINHPGIIEAEAETFAELIFESASARRLRSAVLDLAARGASNIHDALIAAGLGEGLSQIEVAANVENWLRPEGAFEHALVAWREAAHLHARQSFLNNEIDSVSRDLATQGGEERFERLRALVRRRETLLDDD